MSKYIETNNLIPEANVANFYKHADAVQRSVRWLMDADLEEIADYGNELLVTAVDDYGIEIPVYMEFDGSVFEEIEDGIEPAPHRAGRTNTVGVLSDFFVEEQDDGNHQLYARVVSTAVGIEGVYRKLIASKNAGIVSGNSPEGAETQGKDVSQRLSDMHFDVSRRSSRMTDWRFRQTREFEAVLQHEWCMNAEDLCRYISMKTENMREDQLKEYQVALNLFLEEAYREGRSVKASFTDPEAVTNTQRMLSTGRNGEPRLTRVGEEASLISLALKKRAKYLDIIFHMEKASDRDELYELNLNRARGVIFGTLENIRSYQEKSN